MDFPHQLPWTGFGLFTLFISFTLGCSSGSWTCPEDETLTFDPFALDLAVYHHSYFGKMQDDPWPLNDTLFSLTFSGYEVMNRKQMIVQRLYDLIKDLSWHLSPASGRLFRTDSRRVADALWEAGEAEALLLSVTDELASFTVDSSGQLQPEDQVRRFVSYLLEPVHAEHQSAAEGRNQRVAGGELRQSYPSRCVSFRDSLNCTQLGAALAALHEGFVTSPGNLLTAFSVNFTGVQSPKWVVEAVASYLTLLQLGGYAAFQLALHVQQRTEEMRHVLCMKKKSFQLQHDIYISAHHSASGVAGIRGASRRQDHEPYTEWRLAAGVSRRDVMENGGRGVPGVSALTGCQLYTLSSRLAVRCSFSRGHEDPGLWALKAGPRVWSPHNNAASGDASDENDDTSRNVSGISCQWREVNRRSETLCGLGLTVKGGLLDLKIMVCDVRSTSKRRLRKWRQPGHTACTDTWPTAWTGGGGHPARCDRLARVGHWSSAAPQLSGATGSADEDKILSYCRQGSKTFRQPHKAPRRRLKGNLLSSGSVPSSLSGHRNTDHAFSEVPQHVNLNTRWSATLRGRASISARISENSYFNAGFGFLVAPDFLAFIISVNHTINIIPLVCISHKKRMTARLFGLFVKMDLIVALFAFLLNTDLHSAHSARWSKSSEWTGGGGGDLWLHCLAFLASPQLAPANTATSATMWLWLHCKSSGFDVKSYPSLSSTQLPRRLRFKLSRTEVGFVRS